MHKWIFGLRFAARTMLALIVAATALAALGEAQSVREVPTSTRVAGTGSSGWDSDSGSASSTELSGPSYSIFDSHGNQYISDTVNNCIRKVDATTGAISVVAGYESPTSVSSIRPATGISLPSATLLPADAPLAADGCWAAGLTIPSTQGLLAPTGIAFDPAGDLFIADSGHNCIRELPNAAGGATGIRNLQTVVDTCDNLAVDSVVPDPTGILVEGAGNISVAVADQEDGISQVVEYLQGSLATTVCLVGGQPSTLVSNYCAGVTGGNVTLSLPNSIAVDPAGNYFLADTGNHCIRKLSSTGIVSTYLGQCTSDATGTPTAIANFQPYGLAFGPDGYLYISNGDDTVLQYRGASNTFSIFAGIAYSGSQTPPPYSTQQEGVAAVDVSLNAPLGLSFDSTGNLYVVDVNNSIVRRLTLGTQFPATLLHNSSTQQTLHFEVDAPVNLTAAASPDLSISGSNTCSGVLSPAAAGDAPVTCTVTLAFTPTAPGLRRLSLTLTDTKTSPATVFAFGRSGIGLGADALFTPGRIQTPVSGLTSPAAVVVSSNGDAYFAEQGGAAGGGDIKILPAASGAVKDLVPAGSQLTSPSGLAIDAAQTLYIADRAASSIFEVNANGTLSTLGSGLLDPVAVAVDSYGNLLVEQNGPGAVELVKIYAGGEQIVLAGQGNNTAPDNVPATEAQFSKLSGLYLDSSGNIYLSDAGALRVYKLDTAGTIHFFAGNGTTASTDATIPTQAALIDPAGLTGDAAGDLFIAEGDGNRIDVVFGGASQSPGIAQLAGTGTAGNSGDNGPADVAELDNPVSLSLDAADDLFLIDAGNSSLREIGFVDPTLAFGAVKVGQTGGPLSTTLWSAGNQTLATLTSFTPGDTANFHQVADSCGSTLQQGFACQLSFTFTPSATGTYSTTASANADAVDNPQVVTLTGSTLQAPTLVAPKVTAVYGAAYTLSATLSGTQSAAPTGTVMFSIGGVAVCPAAALPANDIATCSPSPTLENAGSYTVTVAYAGDANYLPLTATFTLTITSAPVTIQANNATRPIHTPNPLLSGTIIGVVSGQSITVSGYTTTAVQSSPVGTYPITPTQPAIAGSATLLSNYSTTFLNGTLTVTKAGVVSGTLTAPSVSTVYGAAYALSASVTGSNQSPTPTGSVSFSIGGAALCPASTTPVNATCSPSPTLESAGTYTVTVQYSGDSVYTSATTTLTLAIARAPLTITANNFSRVVNTPNPTFTGVITGIAAGQTVTATYATAATESSPAGTYAIVPTAVAGPGTLLTNYAITVANGTLTVTEGSVVGSFSLEATPYERKIAKTGGVNYTLALTSLNGYSGTLEAACSGLPDGAACSFEPGTLALSAGGTGVMVMHVTATADSTNVPPGSLGRLQMVPPGSAPHAPSTWLAWTMLPLGFGGGATTLLFGRRRGKQRNRGKLSGWAIAAFVAASLVLGLSGCGAPVNFKFYTVTVIVTDAAHPTVAQSTTVLFTLAK